MSKRFFVYRDALATTPLDPYGCDTREEALLLAAEAYGANHEPTIRKEYVNELTVAEAL